ncbi:SDR family NAD(P)-dependent oxidoreductase [Agrobacterium vitis]|uniref:SDR family NAD(P)-dependent oxidoreductase n=1 Tax=Agrobacterium vitis TaxID=373 RepID=A0AAE4WAI2_AGRVI|nr:SDR family oxidoreductase [Agrobacterium vitis]MCF1501723.1 SDR family oxidoreductase [Allorhizobium sp. Av2]MCE6078524.1 SDR family NAD(P)-dependent oxidoreductase [Agrobacterium vitis]MCM2438770.1 SDR family oxidoreductase [Agrobacterium vitis]MCM2453549.1 SDR family oxidoreductase [Agrobacterium vitis]MUO73482.1 SDR family NAD(P)-dependent oxidoreductase [Agrobacterium vitis]
MTSLTGRRGLVVGGSTGIGRAIADAWSEAGMDVLVLSRSRPREQGKLRWSAIDLADQVSAISVLEEASREPLHAVSFAAVHYGDRRTRFSETPLSQWRQQLEVNLNGMWLTLATTLPALRKSGPGLFLNVSSEVVFNGGPGRAGYAATKTGCASLLESVYQEENPDEVRIVSVLPAGMVDSPGIRRRRPADFDYSEYMRPDCFRSIAVELAETVGEHYHGDSLIVEGDGSWHSVRKGVPTSQTDRSRM